MEDEVFEKYVKAGKIWSQTKERALEMAKPGIRLLELAETLEKNIIDAGGGLAFPVNLSLNEEAAHATPGYKDPAILGKDVIKIDVGVHIDGYICDGAFTLDFSGKHTKQIQATEFALGQALSLAQENNEVSSIGDAVEKTLKDAGYKPVQNLTGHGLDRFEQHAHPSIPNIRMKNAGVFEEGHAYAIEPFATTGKGLVHEGARTEIYRFDQPRPLRNTVARQLMETAAREFGNLPFAERMLIEKTNATDFARKMAMKELVHARVLTAYPVLRESGGFIVTQAENTVVLHAKKTVPLIENWPPKEKAVREKE